MTDVACWSACVYNHSELFPGFIFSPATVERTLSTVERDVRVLFKVNLLCVAEWTDFPG